MLRLLVLVEGQTEETFVREVLRPHLYDFNYSLVAARMLGNARQRQRRGGIRGWEGAKKEIVRHLKESNDVHLTTMIDYYALPQDGSKAWPGRAEASGKMHSVKASTVENALAAEVGESMDDGFYHQRFIPYVMMHEFEAMLFSNCEVFCNELGVSHLSHQFQTIRKEFNSPEEINDSPHTAPSKRILSLVPNYEKPLSGSIAAIAIGMNAIRAECPNFDKWITRLEELGNI